MTNNKQKNNLIWCRSIKHKTFGDVLLRIGLDGYNKPVLQVSLFSENVVSNLFVEAVPLDKIDRLSEEELTNIADNCASVLSGVNYKPALQSQFKILQDEQGQVLVTVNRENALVMVFESNGEFFELNSNPEIPLDDVDIDTARGQQKFGFQREEPLF